MKTLTLIGSASYLGGAIQLIDDVYGGTGREELVIVVAIFGYWMNYNKLSWQEISGRAVTSTFIQYQVFHILIP